MLTHKSNTALFGLLMLLLLTLHSFYAPVPVILFVLTGFVYLSLLIWGSASIHSNYHVKTFCKNSERSSKEIAISFDDGPNSTFTPLVLDALKKHEVSATFFCIGKNLQGNESLIQRIAEENHILGNHSYSHSYFFDFFGTEKIKQELLETNKQIEAICGKKVQFFRPPYGVTTPNIAAAVEALKFTTIGWNIRSMDAVNRNESKIVKRVTEQLQPGSVILFHDTHSRILPVLEEVLEHCKKNGYKIVSLKHLLNLEPYA